MKKLTYTAFVAFCASVATLLIVAALSPERLGIDPSAARYTLTAIGEHANAESCWIAVEGGVYDVTQYLALHPTRRSVLLEWCGREATEGMRTKGYGRDHSPAAWASLENYRIGTLEDR